MNLPSSSLPINQAARRLESHSRLIREQAAGPHASPSQRWLAQQLAAYDSVDPSAPEYQTVQVAKLALIEVATAVHCGFVGWDATHQIRSAVSAHYAGKQV